MKLILASRSPERAKILKDLNLEFEVCSADIDESPVEGELVSEMVLRLAKSKASHIFKMKSKPVIAADTLIECNRRPLGQPSDEDHAHRMFEQYKTNPVMVWTASVWHSETELFYDVSKASLEFKNLSEEQWQEFYEEELWKHRAGAFSIFHQPCPMVIMEGDFDVVRGINSQWVWKTYQSELEKKSVR